MKLTRKFVLAVAAAAALVLALSSCTPATASDVPATEQESMLLASESIARSSRAVVASDAKIQKEHPEMVNNPTTDSRLYGTWMSGYYSDVINFSNDACFGRVSLENLFSGMISEGGIYCTENGKVKVLTYVVSNGKTENVDITYKTYDYSFKNGKLILDGKTFSRVR